MQKLDFYSEEYSAKHSQWPYGISSGGAVYRVNDGTTQILLIIRNRADGTRSYNLPKGTLKMNETLEEGAVREIKEESGAEVILKTYLGAHTQAFSWQGTSFYKTLHYYAAEFCKFISAMDSEHDDREWYEIKEAITKCSETEAEKNEADILERLRQYLEVTNASR